jgi:thioredoxin 1
MAVEVTTQNFEEVLKDKNITVLDFWAPWCGPCKMLGPVIDSLHEDNKEKNVTIGKINVDENGTLAAKYGVRGVPTVIFIKDGIEVPNTKLVGLKSKSEFQTVIDSLLETIEA